MHPDNAGRHRTVAPQIGKPPARACRFRACGKKCGGTAGAVAALTRHNGPHGASPASFAPHGPVHSNDEPLELTMIRTLFATTAIAALMSASAVAQDTAPVETPDSTVDQQVDEGTDATTDATPDAAGDSAQDAAPGTTGETVDTTVNDTTTTTTVQDTTRPGFDMAAGYVVADTDNLASNLMGSPVYSSGADDAEQVGTVNDLVFTADG